MAPQPLGQKDSSQVTAHSRVGKEGGMKGLEKLCQVRAVGGSQPGTPPRQSPEASPGPRCSSIQEAVRH